MFEVERDSRQIPGSPTEARERLAAQLVRQGMVRVPGRFQSAPQAWLVAMQITAGARRLDPWTAEFPDLEVVGEFSVPPPGTVQRDFQALHIDFGLPTLGAKSVPVARFTALCRSADRVGSGAATRIVPLVRLLGQRAWPSRAVLAARLRCRRPDDDPVEGVLARIVEAVDQSVDLPAKDTDGFLCGMEFATIEDERHYFTRHGMRLVAAEEEIVLDRGELLVFDNLSIAHGRRGRRQEAELHQLCIGFRSLDSGGQAELLDHALKCFNP